MLFNKKKYSVKSELIVINSTLVLNNWPSISNYQGNQCAIIHYSYTTVFTIETVCIIRDGPDCINLHTPAEQPHLSLLFCPNHSCYKVAKRQTNHDLVATLTK